MGVPDFDGSSGPVRKRQRLSLKSARKKTSSPSSSGNANNSSLSISPKSEVGQSGTSPTVVEDLPAVKEAVSTSSVKENENNTADSRSDTKVPPVSSLENLGNTCFMNGVMQVLRYTPGFLDNLAYLYEDIQASEKIKRKSKVMQENNLDLDEETSQKTWKVVKNLYKVFRDLSRLEEKYDEVASDDVMSMAVKPQKLLNAVREMNCMFEGHMQHDAQEFLRCLLSYMQDAEKEGRKFYSQLPQKFSPKVVLNPMMQKFLQTAKELAKTEDATKTITAEMKTEENEIKKIKVNLFSKPVPKNEAVKSEEEVSPGPKVGDTAGVVEKILKEEPVNETADKLTTETDENKNENSNTACTSKSVGVKGKKGKVAERKRNTSKETNTDKNPLDLKLLQKGKGSASKKRLGMRGAVSVKSADSVLEETNAQKELSLSLGNSPIDNEKTTDNNQNVKQEPMDIADSTVVRSKSESAIDQRNFQDIFSHFVSCLSADDSDTVESISDSDSEDIVLQKKKAKEFHELPRRSPRKFSSLNVVNSANKKYKASPLCISRSESNVNHVKSKLFLSADSNIAEKCNNSGQISPPKLTSDNELVKTSPESLSVTAEQVPSPTKKCVSPKKIDAVGSPSTSVAMEPVVKLENCDFIFSKNEKSVSATYASKCLSPAKKTPRKFSSNYLRQRKLPDDFDDCDSAMFQAALTEMFNSPKKSRSKYDLIERLFQGAMMLKTKCLSCESSRERTEDFHDISVPVRIERPDSDDDEECSNEEGFGLLDLIEASTEIEKLQEDNKYFCDECKRYVEAERSIHYDVMPDILTLHLKRFSHESGNLGYISKINDHVNIPVTLPCLRYKCPKTCLRPDHKYRLYSIITHSGVTLSAGHYLAYVRALPKKPDTSMTKPVSHSKCNGIPETGDQNNTSTKNVTTVTHSSEAEVDKDAKSGSTDKVPVTRRKAGLAPRLPSRFENSVITGTKVKTFASLVPKKVKADITETLKTSVRFTTEWFECDDETVRVFDESDFLDLLSGKDGSLLGTPYLLFYHKATLA